MAVFSFSDAKHSVTSNANLEMDSPLAQQYIQAVCGLDDQVPVASVTLSGMVGTVALKDGRSFAVTVQIGNPPSFMVQSPSFFTQKELPLIQSLCQVIDAMMFQSGMTVLTDTYS